MIKIDYNKDDDYPYCLKWEEEDLDFLMSLKPSVIAIQPYTERYSIEYQQNSHYYHFFEKNKNLIKEHNLIMSRKRKLKNIKI